MSSFLGRPGWPRLRVHAAELAPGVTLSAVVAVAAMALGAHYGAPVMLFALLLGMALNFLSTEGKAGPGIQFNAKGQNDKLKNSAIQNRGGKLVTVAPKDAANAKPELPMKPYQQR